ncbi:hypothetical protein OS493_014829 [Desmophyllum pertusum]|uniref:Uncharacterized protein n=1 Tax=Desmophyllum pertusum TaxID=174260 RepID=A0A9X0CFG6_9CNID|nr:hypothetical protein OS493_014829 [Desmophyllum pertusum]
MTNMQASDQDYQPDDESSGDECAEVTAAKVNELKSGGKLESSRNPDNEFVFDKDWAFRRKCSLQSLLSARALTSTYEHKNSLPKNMELTQRRVEWCTKESPSCNADKRSDCTENKSKKKQNDTTDGKSHTNPSFKSRRRANTVT